MKKCSSTAHGGMFRALCLLLAAVMLMGMFWAGTAVSASAEEPAAETQYGYKTVSQTGDYVHFDVSGIMPADAELKMDFAGQDYYNYILASLGKTALADNEFLYIYDLSITSPSVESVTPAEQYSVQFYLNEANISVDNMGVIPVASYNDFLASQAAAEAEKAEQEAATPAEEASADADAAEAETPAEEVPAEVETAPAEEAPAEPADAAAETEAPAETVAAPAEAAEAADTAETETASAPADTVAPAEAAEAADAEAPAEEADAEEAETEEAPAVSVPAVRTRAASAVSYSADKSAAWFNVNALGTYAIYGTKFDRTAQAANGVLNAPAMPDDAMTLDLPDNDFAVEDDVVAEEPADEPELPANFNIVINYLFENNNLAADPYTATLAAGTDFALNVTFPSVLGYLPYLGDEQVNGIQDVITNIQKDIIYNVVYKPTNVDYTVIYYQQNLNDDNYTEVERETTQGLTNSQVPELTKEYPGFTRLIYERPNIAADGSTVVEVYYDRNYYLMSFDLGGGYGTEPVYARYGAPVGEVAEPSRAGYTFAGWSLDGVKTDVPETMPAENVTYTAIWEAAGKAKVSVVFWGENADDTDYSYINTQEIYLQPDTEFTYSEGGMLVCDKTEHTHDASCYEFTCTKEEHSHVFGCYDSEIVGEKTRGKPIGAPDSPANGQVYTITILSYTTKNIYIDGSWYEYNGTLSNGEIAPTTCAQEEHVHSGYTGSCYMQTCPLEAHTHDSSCYIGGAGLDSNLWTFERSETITVAADGSSVINVYYNRTVKTLTFNYNYRNNKYNSTETISAKWGANIDGRFKSITASAGSSFWTEKRNGDGPFTNYIGIMPTANATYYNRGTTADTGSMYYYGQGLNDGNDTYSVLLYQVDNVGGYSVTDEDRYEFEGFTYDHGTASGKDCANAKFYYTRNSYDLVFNDGYNDVKTESVKYEAPLDDHDFAPNVPAEIEAGSVTFGGWYLNPECTGEEYKLREHNMPANNVLLYAKWTPVTHEVKFYLDQTAWTNQTQLESHPMMTVPHGSFAENVAKPTNGNYTFVGWFYMDNGVEKAFDFDNMPVRKDLEVYGKWSSNVLMPYVIHYVYKDANGDEVKIADDTTGSALAGFTRTFSAKGDTDLYADYREGYFPETRSHSMTMNIEGGNEYTFYYVQKEAVPYTVRYVDASTGEELISSKVVDDNRKAVVTETFARINGHLPDAYQKRLVVSANEPDENVITFYYTKDDVHAYYTITHYTQNTDGETWTAYNESQLVGDIGTVYEANPINIHGFTFDNTVTGTLTSGKLTADGLELKLFYTRNSYPYEVRYLEQGTNKELHEPTTGTALYQKVVSANALDIDGYDVIPPAAQEITIKAEAGDTAVNNVINFYYKEKTVYINYKLVGPYGVVSDNLSEAYGSISNGADANVKVISGPVVGSQAKPDAENEYRFVGWFTDEACTKPVDASWVTDGKLVPQQIDGKYTEATYYAKFEPNYVTLTITKTVDGNFGDKTKNFLIAVYDEKQNEIIPHDLPTEAQVQGVYSDGTKHTYTIPYGKQVTISELNAKDYDMYVTVNNGAESEKPVSSQSIVLTPDQCKSNVNVYIRNYKDRDVDTGVNLDSLPYILVLVAVIAAAVIVVINKKRRSYDD